MTHAALKSSTSSSIGIEQLRVSVASARGGRSSYSMSSASVRRRRHASGGGRRTPPSGKCLCSSGLELPARLIDLEDQAVAGDDVPDVGLR